MGSEKLENDKIVSFDDAVLIASLVNRAFYTVALQFGFTKEEVPSFPAFIDSSVIAGQMAGGLEIFGFKRGMDFIGCIGCGCRDDGIYIIERLAVLPEFRHMGIGEKLMKHAENVVREKQGNKSEVALVADNKILKNWYKKLGYEEIRIEEYVQLPFKVCVMQKVVEE
jgi:ribosomal protein S18 acetylase RimI-like enzyme